MRRGFKTWAERKSIDLRRLLGLQPLSPLPALRLAAHLSVIVIPPSAIPGIPADVLKTLLAEGQGNWSAVTIIVDDQSVIIYNTSHADTRRESDLMHEIAHLICKHKPTRIDPPGVFPWALRTFDAQQEQEAEWLGGCLQVPRDAVLQLVRRGYGNEAIAAHFGSSEDMVRFRRNMTGIDKQVARAANFVSGRITRTIV
ncbi:MAG: ImmA/IrrE family metallo-endopeptidase [Candidatus Udaeobacter sp.]